MAQSFYLFEQAERCRRLARDSTDPALRESPLKLAEEYAVRANAQENDDRTVWQAGSNDQDDY
jgi:hypothetical protein